MTSRLATPQPLRWLLLFLATAATVRAFHHPHHHPATTAGLTRKTMTRPCSSASSSTPRQGSVLGASSSSREEASSSWDAVLEKSTESDDDRTPSSGDAEKDLDPVSEFCISINTLFKRLVISPVREYVEIRPAGTAGSDAWSRWTAPPEVPGIPRPVWLTVLGSVPTALGWYGYYKFSVEEELFQYELQTEGKVTGCGGYGTLFPFVYGVILGFPLKVLGLPLGDTLVEAAGLWILAGQVNLYRRVNELCVGAREELGLSDGRVLWEWWALLPPPLDVVVGLRQVHFLSEYWRVRRGDPYQRDVIAEDWFPFISAKERFTLKTFLRTPSLWFGLTRDWNDLDWEILQEEPSSSEDNTTPTSS